MGRFDCIIIRTLISHIHFLPNGYAFGKFGLSIVFVVELETSTIPPHPKIITHQKYSYS